MNDSYCVHISRSISSQCHTILKHNWIFSWLCVRHNTFVYLLTTHVLLRSFSVRFFFVFCASVRITDLLRPKSKYQAQQVLWGMKKTSMTHTLFFALSLYPVGMLFVVCVVFQRSCMTTKQTRNKMVRTQQSHSNTKWKMKTFKQTVALAIITADDSQTKSDESTVAHSVNSFNFHLNLVIKVLSFQQRKKFK